MNAATVREHFDYDPATGVFTRRNTSRLRRPRTGSVNQRKDTAYGVLCINHSKVYAHRAAWMHAHGDIADDLVIDHLNGNGLDNRLCNLRLVTKTINQLNRRAARSGLIGVYFDKRKRGFKVQIGGKHLAWTRDFFEACCARKSMEARALLVGVSA